jgi:peroxiredoxin Q/BCP
MAMPEPGSKAPPLRLPDGTGNIVDLAAMRGRRVVVFFIPKAATPG